MNWGSLEEAGGAISMGPRRQCEGDENVSEGSGPSVGLVTV